MLYLLQGVASNINQQSSALLQGVLALFPRMPPHPTLVKTALSFLGKGLSQGQNLQYTVAATIIFVVAFYLAVKVYK